MKSTSLLLVLAGMAGAWTFEKPVVDPREKAESDARARYPEALYLWGIGESQTSADEAASRARTRIAEQIDQSIQSTLTNWMQEDQKGNDRTVVSKVVLQERKESRLDNAQIIRCEAPVRFKDGWLVIAALSRSEALGAQVQAYEDTARRYRSRARDALGAGDLSAFTTPWREASRLGLWLKLQGVRFLSIARVPLGPETMGSKHPHAPYYPDDMSLLAQLDSARTWRLSHQRLALVLDNLPGFQPRATQVLKESGISVVAGASDWTLSLRYEKTESESAIGEINRCRLVPTLDLKHESGVTLSSSPIQDAAGEGFKVRDPQAACADALDKIDPAPLDAALQDLLRTAFPLL